MECFLSILLMQAQELEIQNTKQTVLSCFQKAFLFNLQVTTTTRLGSGYEGISPMHVKSIDANFTNVLIIIFTHLLKWTSNNV